MVLNQFQSKLFIAMMSLVFTKSNENIFTVVLEMSSALLQYKNPLLKEDGKKT